MINSIELSDSYKMTRKWVMLFSWFSILWATSALNITKISLPYIKEISFADKSIPLILIVLLIFCLIKMYNEYAMMSILIRRNKLAIFNFNLFLYLAKLAIISLAVSIEVRSVKQIIMFIGSFIPIAIVILVLGMVLGWIIIAIGVHFRKEHRGFAFWVITMFSLGELIAKLMIIISILCVALGLTFLESVRSYFEVAPTIMGIWSISFISILLIIQQHFEGIYSRRLFGFELYNSKTNTLKSYDKNGNIVCRIKCYK